MSIHRQLMFLPLFICLFIVDRSMARFLNGLPGFPFSGSRQNRAPDSSLAEPWPSFVRIVDFADLNNLLFSRPNSTNQKSSIWSSIFNIFTDGTEGSLSDEMERQNAAWFAIPGWNKAMDNGVGIGRTILPGLLVPAKIDSSELNRTAMQFLDPITNKANFPFGFLFNHGLSLNSPFNLPLPNANSIASLKLDSLVPPKTPADSETVEIKPLAESSVNPAENAVAKEARRISKMRRSIFRRALDMAMNDDDAGDAISEENDKKVVSLVEPVKETGELMEEVKPTSMDENMMAESKNSGQEDTRSFGLLSQLASLLAGPALKTFTNEPVALGTLHEPTINNGKSAQM